jgi:tRNA (guanine9-N1)-methyltransferase
LSWRFIIINLTYAMSHLQPSVESASQGGEVTTANEGEDTEKHGGDDSNDRGKKKRPLEAAATQETKKASHDGGDGKSSVSKNQLKKQRRWEKKMEIKKRRKSLELEVKRAKAEAQGRDLDQERQVQQERKGKGKRRQQKMWDEKKLPLVDQSFQVCIDCSFDHKMTKKERNSLAGQIRYCYSHNKHSPFPCRLTATTVGGETLQHLQNVSGYEEWAKRAFTITGDALNDYFKSDLHNVVYLTSDAEHVLTNLDDSKIYVIGGIVDRNRLKGATLERAAQLGVATARLPINEHLQEMASTRVLTCNHVFQLLLKYREHGRDWKKALLDVLPSRKDAKLREDQSDSNKEEQGDKPSS